jgi:hypothetical protein
MKHDIRAVTVSSCSVLLFSLNDVFLRAEQILLRPAVAVRTAICLRFYRPGRLVARAACAMTEPQLPLRMTTLQTKKASSIQLDRWRRWWMNRLPGPPRPRAVPACSQPDGFVSLRTPS